MAEHTAATFKKQLADEARCLMAAVALMDGRTTLARNYKRWAVMMALATTYVKDERNG